MKKNSSRLLILSLAIVLICAGGQLLGLDNPDFSSDSLNLSWTARVVRSSPRSPGRKSSSADLSGWKTFKGQGYGFEFKYPPGGQLQTYGATKRKKVKVDLPITRGTLLEKKFLLIKEVKIPEERPALLSGEERGKVVFIDGKKFTKKEVTEGAAGHIYEHTIYSTRRGDRGLILDFVLHSTNPGVYESPPPDFDRSEAEIFEKILSTFKFKVDT